MFVTKICYIPTELGLTNLMEKLNDVDDLDYSYRSIEGGDEVEIEADKKYLDSLLKLKFIKQENMVKWKGKTGDIIADRYYYVFKENELESLIDDKYHIEKSFYELGNWGVIIQV